jgi:hypothetical protein
MEEPDYMTTLAPEIMSIPKLDKDGIDWSLTTWKGSRLEQHRAFQALPFRRKLELVEEMCDQVRFLAESRRRQGLPYRDPHTGEIVRPALPEGVTSEETPTGAN